MTTCLLCPDRCKGAALCPASDDSCPSVAEAGIARLTAERERDEAAKACRVALSYLTDDAARADLTDGGMARYDDAVDALRDIVAKHPAPQAEEERHTWPEWGRIFQDERSISLMSDPSAHQIRAVSGCGPDEPITREAAERLLLTCSQFPRPRRVAAEAEEEGAQ